MNRLPTETALRDWRTGSTQAERLCADILRLEGFTSVDPQCPLGGPDGLKDVLCVRGFQKWVAAVYFPPTASTFADVKRKFQHDLGGVATSAAHGIVFFTNQRLTPKERDVLLHLAEQTQALAELYHVERLRGILDSPTGFGARLTYLDIEMTREDQATLFGLVENNTHSVDALSERIDRLLAERSNVAPGENPQPALDHDFFLEASSLTGLFSLLVAYHACSYEHDFSFEELGQRAGIFSGDYAHGFLAGACCAGLLFLGDAGERQYVRYFDESLGKKLRPRILTVIEHFDDQDFRSKMKSTLRIIDQYFGHFEPQPAV